MSSGGGPGGAQSSVDAVRSAKGVTESVQSQFEAARKNPEKEIGIPLEELNRRQQEARRPHAFVNEETKRKFDVKSSARAQQIMNRGVDKYQREKRQSDLKGSLKMLRKVQVVLCFGAAGLFGWLAVCYLLPQYNAVQHRNKRMQMRYERAQRSREAGAAADPTIVGPVVRVFRVEEDGTAEAKPVIQ